MLEIGLLSLEGGGALNPLSLPLSTHGMMDDLIPIEESQKQVELVRKAGLQVEWKEIVKGHTIDPFGEMMLIRRFIEQCFKP